MNHLPVLAILVPLLGGALSLFVEHRRFGTRVQRLVAWTAMLALLLVAMGLAYDAATGGLDVYLLGDWPSRLGIVLVADRLSSTLVLATTLLAVACLLHACAGWDRRAPHFHALFQLQLVGLNGAFLTGDLFNLFVFIEVMLIASYGLLLSGGRGVRMSAGLHYAGFNIAASTLLLIALGLLYGLLGTLNMGEMALRIQQVAPADVPLVKAAIGLLLVVFCSKAALLPLSLWLPETYTRAPASVAALFVVMTKVGLYAVLRVGTLMLGAGAGAFAGYGWDWMLPAAVAGLALASLGVLAAARMRTLAAYLVMVSSATLFIAFGLGQPGTLAAGLYYLVHSLYVGAALFMLAELVRRGRDDGGNDIRDIVPMPALRARASVLFLVAAVSIVGLPPLSGFIAKLALLQAVPAGQVAWVWVAILGSSMMVLVGLARAGVRLFWMPVAASAPEPTDPRRRAATRPAESAAIVLLLVYGIGMTAFAQPLLRHARATADQLLAPSAYVERLRSTAPEGRLP